MAASTVGQRPWNRCTIIAACRARKSLTLGATLICAMAADVLPERIKTSTFSDQRLLLRAIAKFPDRTKRTTVARYHHP